MIVGVISDTHNLLRPQVFKALSGADCIIHAGDIGAIDILRELQNIAPVHAVYGNCDRFPLTEQLKDRERLEIGKLTAFVTHIGSKPKEMHRFYPEMAGADLVVFGHSHRALHVVESGVTFFNPGSAGPRRFSFPATVGRIEISGRDIRAQIIELTD